MKYGGSKVVAVTVIVATVTATGTAATKLIETVSGVGV